MKLICLNTWGGRAGNNDLLQFFKNHGNVDIFCLQEVWEGGEHMLGKTGGGQVMSNVIVKMLSEVSALLPQHKTFFRPHFYDFWGLALFVKDSYTVLSEGEHYVYKEKGFISEVDIADHARMIQYATIETSGGLVTVAQLHGLWTGVDKLDTPDRIEQSKNIIQFLNSISTPVILCGDFNLSPDTESVKMLERFGLKNLISEFGVRSTRTAFYRKENRYADYIFVSDGIRVNDFKVLPDEVSDHAALYLDFE